MSIGPVVTSGGDGMTSQKSDGADGNQIDHETVVETDSENETPLHPNKRSDSSTTSVAGKIGNAARKTKNLILGSLKKGQTTQKLLLLRRRCQTLDCQGRSQKTPTRSVAW